MELNLNTIILIVLLGIHMYDGDILVIVYPNLQQPQQVFIINPLSYQVQHFQVSSQEEVQQVIQEHLPWCDQEHDEPIIHLGLVHVVEWSGIQSQISSISLYTILSQLQQHQ
jgi:hypothetical protein